MGQRRIRGSKGYLNSKGVFILPVLLEECEIPLLLTNIKYADFSRDPGSAYRELVEDVNYHSKSMTMTKGIDI
jgi:hypothetical protein